MAVALREGRNRGTELDRLQMTDKRWRHEKGWVKVVRHINGVEIHWVRNRTGQVDDFKFK